ncbi:response regulator transcription factor [Sphingomonas hengshuiensis]|uniref:response regulator transcription factor n=1 Tax=Sphingomonas hengshuiensis TaxID=1609977 RepID=UPI000AA3F8DA|nr:response regulator [Sphingomonas hengshuiensis]
MTRIAAQIVAIVEDDESVRIAMRGLVRSYGFTAEAFESGEAYLAADAPERTGCLITDVEMPGMDGFALVRRLGERGCHTPVVMVSAGTSPDLEGRALECGARGLLRKPFPAAALIAHLDATLGAGRA